MTIEKLPNGIADRRIVEKINELVDASNEASKPRRRVVKKAEEKKPEE